MLGIFKKKENPLIMSPILEDALVTIKDYKAMMGRLPEMKIVEDPTMLPGTVKIIGSDGKIVMLINIGE